MPGFVDFILQGNSNYGGGGGLGAEAGKSGASGFHSHTAAGEKKDNEKLEQEID